MGYTSIIGFFLAVLPLVVTPGASFTLTTQRTVQSYPHAAAWVIAGTATGIYCHAFLSALGLSAVVMRSSQAFEIIRLVGAVYLIGLGLATLLRRRAEPPTRAPRRLPWARLHTYPQALLANLLNPKAASVYLTLAPQFITSRHMGIEPMLLLASVHVAVMALWLGGWATALTRAARLTATRLFKLGVRIFGGAVLVTAGLRSLLKGVAAFASPSGA